MDLLGFIDNWSVPDSMGREPVPWRCYRSRVVRFEDEFLLLCDLSLIARTNVSASLASVIFEVVVKDIG